jgi:PST family polysaccharide transporter
MWPGEGSKELLITGAGFMMGQVGNFLARQIDYVIVGRVLGAAPLGYYNRAYQFLMLPAQLFGTAVTKVLFPSIASIQDQPQRVARAFLRAMGVIAMLTLPATGYLVVLAPELVLMLLGREWVQMIVPVQILLCSLLFRTSYKISDAVCLAMGSMYQRAWRQWIYAGAVALGAAVGTQWGLAGVAVGVGLAVVLNYLAMLNLALTVTDVTAKEVWAVHLRHFGIAIPFSAAVWGAATIARGLDFGRTAVLSVGSLTAATALALLWFGFRGVFGDDGRWVHQLAISRLRRL